MISQWIVEPFTKIGSTINNGTIMAQNKLPNDLDNAFKLRGYRRDAYGEADILRDETSASIRRTHYKHVFGMIMLGIISLVMLYLIVFFPENSKKFEIATNIILLVVGSVVGFLYGTSGSDSK